MKGKILFYNTQTGEGKLLLESKEQLSFDASHWLDFESNPEPGSFVACTFEEGILQSLEGLQSKPVSDKPVQPAAVDSSASIMSPEVSFDYETSATFDVDDTLKNYFQAVEEVLGEPPEILNTKEQFDYHLIKPFLMTTYNNLKAMDPNMSKDILIKSQLTDIKHLQNALESLDRSLSNAKHAFEMIFLRSQPEYLRFIRHKEQCLQRVSLLTRMEESLFPEIKKKEKALKEIPAKNKKKRTEAEEELKSIRRQYVSTIHENSNVKEELRTMEDLKKYYTQQYYQSFNDALQNEGGKYQLLLLHILNYRTFSFDATMWKYAANSKIINEFFQSSNIKGDFSILTYLRYFLKTLDPKKITDKTKELFKLAEYLEKKMEDSSNT